MIARLLAAAPEPPNDRTALYALIGVVAAALITAVGGIMVAWVGKKREMADGDRRRPPDEVSNEIKLLVQTYQDARRDLEQCRTRIEELEKEAADAHAEATEARALCDYFMGELEKHHHPEEGA